LGHELQKGMLIFNDTFWHQQPAIAAPTWADSSPKMQQPSNLDQQMSAVLSRTKTAPERTHRYNSKSFVFFARPQPECVRKLSGGAAREPLHRRTGSPEIERATVALRKSPKPDPGVSIR
jgi:hypothetical protein